MPSFRTKTVLVFGSNRAFEVALNCGFRCKYANTVKETIDLITEDSFDIIVIAREPDGPKSNGSPSDPDDLLKNVRELCKTIRLKDITSFICIFSSLLSKSPAMRLSCVDLGANMVTGSGTSLSHVLEIIGKQQCGNGHYKCPICAMDCLTEDELWRHVPLYHINSVNTLEKCPVCDEMSEDYIQVHIHNAHGPPGRGEMLSEYCPDVPIFSFALVVCQRSDGKYLMVQEFCNQGYSIPGGGCDPGEGLTHAALREVREETGVDVELTGILKIEYHAKGTPKRSSSVPFVRLRTIFMARPVDENTPLKTIPDYESAGAAWVDPKDLANIKLRSVESQCLINSVANEDVTVYPMSILDCRDSHHNSRDSHHRVHAH